MESGAMLGGIAAGLSARTRIDVTLVRIGLVVAVLLSGGVVAAAYVIAWLLLPVDGQQETIGQRAWRDRDGIGVVVAIASLLAVVLIVASATAAHWVDTFAWAAAATAAGLVLIWRNGPPAER
ncbi:MAG TPA: PspC domain-containing protein, partial [Acidimicrobiales bacterium]|nr:PspC domain-containing protein [Acidimicrobiales bacterium]